MSIASGFRGKWSTVLRSADETRGQNDDARFAAAARAADDAGLHLVGKVEIEALVSRIKELETAAPSPVTQDHRERAREIAACPHPVGASTCPYSWGSCRRSGKCDMAEEIATALSEAEARGRGELEKVVEALGHIERIAAHALEDAKNSPRRECRHIAETARAALSSVKGEKDLAKECE